MDAHISEKRHRFHKLHESGCFMLPNPWDIGSAQVLQTMGFAALASTSAGFAWSIGRRDNALSLEQVLDHLRVLCAATDLPVNADFESGFADDPETVAANVRLAAATGIAGVSIEDRTDDAKHPLYEKPLAIERVRAARAAIDAEKSGVLLVARSEGFLVGRPDLTETIDRLVAFAEAGADCLYAPGLRTKEQITALVQAVAPKPVNVLMGGPGLRVADLAEWGVRRVSVGSAMARGAWDAFLKCARDLAETGTLASLEGALPYAELNAKFNA